MYKGEKKNYMWPSAENWDWLEGHTKTTGDRFVSKYKVTPWQLKQKSVERATAKVNRSERFFPEIFQFKIIHLIVFRADFPRRNKHLDHHWHLREDFLFSFWAITSPITCDDDDGMSMSSFKNLHMGSLFICSASLFIVLRSTVSF